MYVWIIQLSRSYYRHDTWNRGTTSSYRKDKIVNNATKVVTRRQIGKTAERMCLAEWFRGRGGAREEERLAFFDNILRNWATAINFVWIMRESGEENNWKLSDCSHPLFTSFSKFHWSPMGPGRHSCAAALCTRVTHTHERSRVFICKYSTRRHERTNLRFHRISSLIDSYIRRAGLHARTNRVVFVSLSSC